MRARSSPAAASVKVIATSSRAHTRPAATRATIRATTSVVLPVPAPASTKNVVSNSVDVKGVVQSVTSGDADAGIVYVTDVTPGIEGQVRVVAIPDAVNVVATYPIAVVKATDHRRAAEAFVKEIVAGKGRQALQARGFLPAP